MKRFKIKFLKDPKIMFGLGFLLCFISVGFITFSEYFLGINPYHTLIFTNLLTLGSIAYLILLFREKKPLLDNPVKRKRGRPRKNKK